MFPGGGMPGAMLLAMLWNGGLHECHAGPCLAATMLMLSYAMAIP